MPSLVSVDEVRARVKAAVSLSTDAVQGIIDGNEVLLNSRVRDSAAGPVTVTLDGYPMSVLLLPERVASITSVTEHWLFTDASSDLLLDDTDWRLAPSGTAIERLTDGVNQRDSFADRVVIEYEPLDTLALRKNILIELCAADLGFTPGIQSQTLGDYSETKASSQSGQASIVAIKEDILAQLAPQLPLFS